MDVPVSTIQAFHLLVFEAYHCRAWLAHLPIKSIQPNVLSLKTLRLFPGPVVFSPRVTGKLSQILRIGPGKRSLVAADVQSRPEDSTEKSA